MLCYSYSYREHITSYYTVVCRLDRVRYFTRLILMIDDISYIIGHDDNVEAGRRQEVQQEQNVQPPPVNTAAAADHNGDP